MSAAAPVFFFAPFVSSTMRIEPAWIDYNGHMNMAYFHVFWTMRWRKRLPRSVWP